MNVTIDTVGLFFNLSCDDYVEKVLYLLFFCFLRYM